MRLNKRIPTLTLNVAMAATRQVAANGGEWIELQVFASRQAVAATSDGRYFLRVGDESRPLMPEDLARLAGDIGTTIFHPVGTCRMGSDQDAVVDAQLRVHGVPGLRIADASIMPQITSGNTCSPTLMIGEKAAHLILQAAPVVGNNSGKTALATP